MRVVVMGVAGSGKSTLGVALASALGCVFQEGDDLHSAANRAKTAAGRALDEGDRAPWLDAVATWLAERRVAGESGVVSCSALKRSHRDRLRLADQALRFVLPNPTRSVLERRLAIRTGHLFPARLLQSQCDTFEPPTEDEGALLIDPAFSVAEAVRVVRAWLARTG